MPFCPNCNYEYVEGIKECPDCGTKLVDVLEEPVEYNEADWKVVFTSNLEYEVEMMKDNLEGAGISAAILDQKDRNFPAPGDFSVIKLLVKKEDVPSATEFIDKYKSDTNSSEKREEEA